MNLQANTPAKREFRHVQTLIRGLRAQGERMYKKNRPKQKRTGPVSTTTGFNCLALSFA